MDTGHSDCGWAGGLLREDGRTLRGTLWVEKASGSSCRRPKALGSQTRRGSRSEVWGCRAPRPPVVTTAPNPTACPSSCLHLLAPGHTAEPPGSSGHCPVGDGRRTGTAQPRAPGISVPEQHRGARGLRVWAAATAVPGLAEVAGSARQAGQAGASRPSAHAQPTLSPRLAHAGRWPRRCRPRFPRGRERCVRSALLAPDRVGASRVGSSRGRGQPSPLGSPRNLALLGDKRPAPVPLDGQVRPPCQLPPALSVLGWTAGTA